MVDVDAGALDRCRLPGLAAVGAALDVDVDGPNPVGAIRIDEDLVVVLRAAAAIAVVGRDVAAARRPAAPPVPLLLPHALRLPRPRWRQSRPEPGSIAALPLPAGAPGAVGTGVTPSGAHGGGGAGAAPAFRRARSGARGPAARAPRPPAIIRPIRDQELPPSSDRKKPDSGRLASMRAKTVAGFLRPSIASPARPMSPVGRPLVSFVHVLPALVVL